jgi:hypothetical protein
MSIDSPKESDNVKTGQAVSFDRLDIQETANRGLIVQATVQAEVVIEDDELRQSLLQTLESSERMPEALMLDDFDEGFGFAWLRASKG